MFTFVLVEKIIEIIPGALYGIKWEGEESHPLDCMSEKLGDAFRLTEFFQKRTKDLQYYKKNVQDAVQKTLQENKELIKELYTNAKNANKNINPNLDELFTPLHKDLHYNHPRFYTDFKTKGRPDTAPWIRIYAVKADSNLYFITGFGIKLVREMKDDDYLQNELTKLDQATTFLLENDFLEP